MNLIVAVDKNWGIGKNGDLLMRIPEDMKYFKNLTYHHTVVMGRKTLESFPGQKPLPQRKNIVLSTQTQYTCEGAEIYHDIPSFLEDLKKYKPNDIFIIGGGIVYDSFLPYCKTAYVTKIDHIFEADTFFTNLDNTKDWKLTDKTKPLQYNGVSFCFTKYERL